MQRKHWLFFFYFSDSFLRIITYFDKFVTDCLQKYVGSVKSIKNMKDRKF